MTKLNIGGINGGKCTSPSESPLDYLEGLKCHPELVQADLVLVSLLLEALELKKSK